EIETEMATGTVFNDTINGTKYPSYTITIPANSAWLTLAAYRDEDENGVAGPYERFGTSAVNVEEAHIVNDMPWYFPDLGEPGAPFQVTLNTPEDGSSQTASYYKFTAGAHSDYAIGTNTSKEIKVYSDVEFTNELASCVTNVEMCRLSADLGISFADGDIIYFKLIGSGQYTLTVTSYQ
ncbi:MAG: hypothetical protein OEZ59_13655, partial [Deltaproteobacteria bacterium]|nr:hypothetical protein [Deltaproteobacteria bacterium]